MRYQLVENYFQTELFQTTVQSYFDTVLGQLMAENTTLSAKGLFVVDGVQKRDYYDMPYHIHILNGLIPVLFVYEKYLQEKGWIEDSKTELYLRIFILGFTFHDANKLLRTQQTRDRSDLEVAVVELDKQVGRWDVQTFLPQFIEHKSTVYFLALGTEYGTAVASGDYKLSVNNWNHIAEVQRELCHLADGLASIQNEHLESLEALYKAVEKSLSKIKGIINLPISYLKVRSNPYTLLGQNLLQVARKELNKNGKKVLYATQEGFIFWGKDLVSEEFEAIKRAYLVGSEDDIKFLELTKIDSQKCKFGFIGSTPFTIEILDRIVDELGDKFLSLSPNSEEKISDFDSFIKFTVKLLEGYEIPIDDKIRDSKLILHFYETLDNDEKLFKQIYGLHKIQWLNAKVNKDWKKDFDNWIKQVIELPRVIEVEQGEENFEQIANTQDVLQFINKKVRSTNALYKTYLNFIKTYEIIETVDDIEAYIINLQKDIITAFKPKQNNNVKEALFERYFECRGNTNLHFLENYNPIIPNKKEMCAFTGGIGTVAYKAEVAFAMKARGFSNRTITALNNNTNHISTLFVEENKLRASNFKVADANLVIYYDFFEARLDIDRDIIQACVQAKNELQFLDNGTIQFDKNSKFQYNLFNLEFVKVAPKVEPIFHLVRKCLRMAHQLGIRSYIAGIMTPYQPHKAVFHFENAPRFLKLLGWNSVRLIALEEVLDEMRLVLTLGKSRIEGNLLKIAQSRLAYFTIYYHLHEKDKVKVYNTLLAFYQKYKHKFFDMTITEQLVALAVKIDVGFRSSAEETWLIRTALDFLRKYHKQGYSREDIIQKICGEIFRKMRMKNPSMDTIRAFSEAVYDKLFMEDWKGTILTINAEKDWIYQFAFLFREHSLEIIRTRKAKKIREKLEVAGKAINEENIKALLAKESKRHAQQYLKIIQKLQK